MPEKSKTTTLFDILIRSRNRHPDRTAFIYRAAGREYSVSYEKFFIDVLLLSRAFRKKRIEHGSRVMVLSDNRYGWIVTDMALVCLGAIGVPRGSDTPSSELEYIMDHAGCEFLVIENEELLGRHRQMIDRLPGLKLTFIIEAKEQHRFLDPIYSYRDLLGDRTITEEEIEAFIGSRERLTAEDTVTIVYTSGTTGKPKGVPLCHRNLLHQVENLPTLIELTEQDRWLSVLPSWHIFERTVEYIGIAAGSTLIYSSIKTFAADLEHYRPTIVATVPRLWESLYTRIGDALQRQSPRKARLFETLVKVSIAARRNLRRLGDRLPIFRQRPLPVHLWRKALALVSLCLLLPCYLVACRQLAMVQQKFGGALRLAISGGGSLPPYLDEWIDAVGIRIVNAYGMTECSPAIAGRSLSCHVFGTLGPPVPGTQLRIVDEQGRPLPAGIEGEVQVCGPQVFSGYYRDREENANVFTADGFFRTGDLGRLTLSGELVLTGRSKELIVLASGENVDPTHIEGTISMLPFVNDAVLVGQDKKGLGALIVPDREKLRAFVTERIGSLASDTEDFLHDRQVISRVKSEINRLLQPKKGFKPFERLAAIGFLEEGFQAGEELTNTLKKRRHVIERKYRQQIDELLK